MHLILYVIGAWIRFPMGGVNLASSFQTPLSLIQQLLLLPNSNKNKLRCLSSAAGLNNGAAQVHGVVQ